MVRLFNFVCFHLIQDVLTGLANHLSQVAVHTQQAFIQGFKSSLGRDEALLYGEQAGLVEGVRQLDLGVGHFVDGVELFLRETASDLLENLGKPLEDGFRHLLGQEPLVLDEGLDLLLPNLRVVHDLVQRVHAQPRQGLRYLVCFL